MIRGLLLYTATSIWESIMIRDSSMTDMESGFSRTERIEFVLYANLSTAYGRIGEIQIASNGLCTCVHIYRVSEVFEWCHLYSVRSFLAYPNRRYLQNKLHASRSLFIQIFFIFSFLFQTYFTDRNSFRYRVAPTVTHFHITSLQALARIVEPEIVIVLDI